MYLGRAIRNDSLLWYKQKDSGYNKKKRLKVIIVVQKNNPGQCATIHSIIVYSKTITIETIKARELL